MSLIDGFKRFAAKEPMYLWIIVFIITVNVLGSIITLGQKEAGDPAGPFKRDEITLQGQRIEAAIRGNERASSIVPLITSGIAALIFAGLVLDFKIFLRKAEGRELLERSYAPPAARWDIWDALKVIILFFFFGYTFLLAEAFLAPALPFLESRQRALSIVNTTLLDSMSMVVVFYFTVRIYGHKIRDLGLSLKDLFRNISYGILGYLALLPALAGGLVVTMFFVRLFNYQPKPQPVFEFFMAEKNASALMYLTFFVAVIGPVMEEIFFRGFLYSAIRKEAGIKWAVIISAALFSFLHGHVAGFLPILILGLLLAYLYEKTGSIVSSVTLHILHNVLMTSFVLFLKWIPY